MTISTEDIVAHLNDQNIRIAILDDIAERRQSKINRQDESMNVMYQENVNLARKIDYYRLVTGLLIIALALCILL